MNYPSNFKQYIISATMLFAGIQIQAQDVTNDVQGLSTDSNFNNTTIVYKREAANDLELLTKMGGGFGMGDVVRVTVAPPTPAPAATLNTAPKPVATPKPAIQPNKVVVTQANIAVAKANDAPQQKAIAPVAINKPVVVSSNVAAKQTAAPKVVAAPKQTTAPVVAPAPHKVTKTTGNGHAKKSNKSAHKSKRRNGFSLFERKWNPTKHGKQRYSCPKF